MKTDISVLVAARDEYIEQLKSIMVPLLIQGFNSIYTDALRISGGSRIIYKFQELLKEIPTWNGTILQEESKRIKKKCPYIMDIVTAIFVSNVKILASIRLKGNNENIRVKIPTSDIFIHSIYIESAQDIFYDPYLFYNTKRVQENKEVVKGIIRNSIDETIRQMLPFDDILQEYLVNALDSDNDLSDDSEPELNGKNIIGDEEEPGDEEESGDEEEPGDEEESGDEEEFGDEEPDQNLSTENSIDDQLKTINLNGNKITKEVPELPPRPNFFQQPVQQPVQQFVQQPVQQFVQQPPQPVQQPVQQPPQPVQPQSVSLDEKYSFFD